MMGVDRSCLCKESAKIIQEILVKESYLSYNKRYKRFYFAADWDIRLKKPINDINYLRDHDVKVRASIA